MMEENKSSQNENETFHLVKDRRYCRTYTAKSGRELPTRVPSQLLPRLAQQPAIESHQVDASAETFERPAVSQSTSIELLTSSGPDNV